MTKADIAMLLYEKLYYLGINRNKCNDLADLVISVMSDAIVSEGRLKIPNFGVFEVKTKRSRRGRNPQTGSDLTIDARKILTFKPSQKLKTSVSTGKKQPNIAISNFNKNAQSALS